MDEKKQTQEFDLESYRYISSYINDGRRNDMIIPKSINEELVNSILDVGCGNGGFLNAWKNHFSVKGVGSAIGIEPSAEGIKLVK